MATHTRIPAWNITWTQEPGGLQCMGSQKVGHDWVAEHPRCAGREDDVSKICDPSPGLPSFVSCPRSERLGYSGSCTIASKGHYWGAKETQGEACFKSKMLRYRPGNKASHVPTGHVRVFLLENRFPHAWSRHMWCRTGIFKLAGARGTLELLQGPTGATRGQKVTGILRLEPISLLHLHTCDVLLKQRPHFVVLAKNPSQDSEHRHLCSCGLKQHHVTETHQEPCR